MPRTSNDETSDPDQPGCRATRGSDRSVRRASDRAGVNAGGGLDAGAERLRVAVTREQADRRGALRGSEELDRGRDAADAGPDRAGTPQRKELGRRLPGHEVAGADPGRVARSGPRSLQPRPPLSKLTRPPGRFAPPLDSRRPENSAVVLPTRSALHWPEPGGGRATIVRRMRRLGILGVVSLALLIVTLGLIEVTGRWFFIPLLARYSSQQDLNLQLLKPKDLGVAGIYVPHHYYLYGPRPSYRSLDTELRHNSRGCRAEDGPLEGPETVVRIVALGGSTTYSTLVRQNNRIYTYLLETLLNDWAKALNLGRRFEVLNCGVPGATSAENLSRYIFDLSEYRADLLLIQQGINDAVARAFPHLSRDYREYSKTWDETYLEPPRWFIARAIRAVKNKVGDSIWNKGINILVRHKIPDGSAAENYERNGPQIFEANTRYLVRLAA